jgi:hypothetical protein
MLIPELSSMILKLSEAAPEKPKTKYGEPLFLAVNNHWFPPNKLRLIHPLQVQVVRFPALAGVRFR